MLECQTAMAGAALRLRLLYRMLRAGELVALVALVSWSSSYVPSAVAAALRLAGSLLLNARFVFLLGNAIVLLLFALSRHDGVSVPSSSDDEQQQQQQQQPAASTATSSPPSSPSLVPPVTSAADIFPSFTAPTTAATSHDELVVGGAVGASFATPAAPPTPRTQEAVVPAPRAAASKAFDDERLVRPNKAFDDDDASKHLAARLVTTTTKVRAPRRSRSEKMGRRAASPELRRCESENGARRRRSSVTARDAEACWGREDADEFRRQVEAFIARQTRFHREESMTTMRHCEAAPAFTGALAVVE